MADNTVPAKQAFLATKKKWLLLISIFLLVLFFFLYYQITKPPDLSKCNRIVIQYYPSTYGFLNYSHALCQSDCISILSEEDEEYVRSFSKTLEVNDIEQIKKFAHEVSLARFKIIPGELNRFLHAHVDCYDNNNLISSFYINVTDIITEHGWQFHNPSNEIFGLTNILIPPGVKPLQIRSGCAKNMRSLYIMVLKPKYQVSYPDPNRWCDLVSISKSLFAFKETEVILGWLKCPDANEGKSNYAINPNCKPNWPENMVLLFETKAGWNQHGGPELFTFDNHDPKGGCVLLNDGTVKFIRTKEELNALRWK